MEKAVIPTWPYYIHFKDIKARYGRDVRITTLNEEEISIIESLSEEVKVADILEAFAIKTKKQYLKSAEQRQKTGE